MSKALKTYLLTLCVLLLSGYGYLYANSSLVHRSSLQTVFEKSGFSDIDVHIKNQNLTIRCAHSSDSENQENGKSYFEKNEEEEAFKSFSSKKCKEVTNHLAAFYPKFFGYLYITINNYYPSRAHGFYSDNRFILLRVLRI